MPTQKQVLYLVPARLGDAVMTTAALSKYKLLNPNTIVDVLATSKIAKDVYLNNPNCRQIFLLSELLNTEQFFLSYAYVVIVLSDKKAHELMRQYSFNAVVNNHSVTNSHQTDHYLDLINNVFNEHDLIPTNISDIQTSYSVQTSISDTSSIQHKFDIKNPYLVLHMGCHGIAKPRRWWQIAKRDQHGKAWSVENYIALTKLINLKFPYYKIVITGGKEEQGLADAFIEKIPSAVNLMGITSVQELKVLIQHALIFISGDTGAMHVACTTDTPLIALFGNTSAIMTGPYPATDFRIVLKSNPISAIEPLLVYQTVLGLINNP